MENTYQQLQELTKSLSLLNKGENDTKIDYLKIYYYLNHKIQKSQIENPHIYILF